MHLKYHSSAEAQYRQAYNAVRTLIVFLLFRTIFYLLQQVIQSLVILRTLSKVRLLINNQRLFLLRSPLTEARQRRRAIGGPNDFCKTALFIFNL